MKSNRQIGTNFPATKILWFLLHSDCGWKIRELTLPNNQSSTNYRTRDWRDVHGNADSDTHSNWTNKFDLRGRTCYHFVQENGGKWWQRVHFCTAGRTWKRRVSWLRQTTVNCMFLDCAARCGPWFVLNSRESSWSDKTWYVIKTFPRNAAVNATLSKCPCFGTPDTPTSSHIHKPLPWHPEDPWTSSWQIESALQFCWRSMQALQKKSFMINWSQQFDWKCKTSFFLLS